MRRMLALLLMPAAVLAQPDSARLTVTTDPPGAVVFIDSAVAGVSPVLDAGVTAGVHVVRCTADGNRFWPAAAGAETLLVHPGDTVACHVVLPRVYHIVSDPPSARIILGDSVIAETPCFLTDRYKGKPLAVRAPGCQDGLLVLPESSGVVTLRLSPSSGELPTGGPLITESQQRDLLPVYLSAGSAVLSGAAAAYFKIKADSYYNDYRATGDPALLDKIHRFDTASGVALVVSQLSLGALAYLLLLR